MITVTQTLAEAPALPTRHSPPRLSVVIPVYRGEKTIGELVLLLIDCLANTYPLEIVLVNDGSPDNSADICRSLALGIPLVKFVNLSRNFSEHNAVMAGLNYCDGDYVVIMDDDFQNPPEEVAKLVEEIEKGYDVVFSRYAVKQHSWLRNLGSRVNDWFAVMMLDKPRDLYLSSFKILSRFVVNQLIKYDGPYPYVDGLILRFTRNYSQVLVTHAPRREGRSGYTLRKLVSLYLNMFTNFSILPLRLASYAGLASSFLGLVVAAVFVCEKIANPELPAGWASLMVSLFIIGGIQLFALGMIGEYLGRLFLKDSGRPQFVVREQLNCKPHHERDVMSLADAFHGRNVLITGGLGFLGSNLALKLVRYGANVTILDSLVPQFGGSFFNIAPVRKEVVVNISDMRDSNSLDILVQGKDYIFNLAGQVSHGDSMRDPQLDLAVNCVSTMNLVEACRKHNTDVRMLYSSTRQVYGRPQKLPVTEDHPTVPIDVNGINKLAAEYYHLLYHGTYGIRSTVLRMTNTFGPRQQIRSNRQGFATIFLRQALRGETVSLFGGGEQVRDFNYVDDVVSAMLLAITNNACMGQFYNLGSTRAYSLIQFVDILKKLCTFNVESVPFPQDKKIIDIGDYYGDFSKFHAATGWNPEVDLEAGLEKTVAFYREHREVYWQ